MKGREKITTTWILPWNLKKIVEHKNDGDFGKMTGGIRNHGIAQSAGTVKYTDCTSAGG